MATTIPSSYKVLVLRKATSKPVYHDIAIEYRTISSPLQPGYILVKLNAASYNRRDLWMRVGKYPFIGFDTVIGSDGAGVVVASGDNDDTLLNKRVFLTPMRGWESHPDAPENSLEFVILGGMDQLPTTGTFAEYVVVERKEVILSPAHLDDVHVAAWPLAGLTSWRATVVNGQVEADHNVLITGIGGGVALLAMQICVAKGANVYITSGDSEKIKKAVSLGAKHGFSYKDKDWPSKLAGALRADSILGKPPLLDCVIDSGGSDIMTQVGSVLKPGGRVVCYGMTASPKITMTMREVLRNQRLIGSTMGSRRDLIDATQFLNEKKIVPVVSHVLGGLESAEEGFHLLKRGDQFGKVVINLQSAVDGKYMAKL